MLPNRILDRLRRSDATKGLPAAHRLAFERRAATLIATLTGRPPTTGLPADVLNQELAAALVAPDGATTWLALAVLSSQLPDVERVLETRRAAELEGPGAVIAAAIADIPVHNEPADVHVVTGDVLVDIEHLAHTALGTGIQRVTRETMRRWSRNPAVVAVGWTHDLRALRQLTERETARALGHPAGTGSPVAGAERADVVVPWLATYVLPEVALEVDRTRRMQAMFRFSRSTATAIGFDLVPLTSAETCADDVPPHFALELSAIRHTHRVAAISQAARTEYVGWRTMVRAMGIPGPDVEAISLPVEAPVPSAAELAAARERYTVPSVPLVLCVGSHEPRKNHLAVLHAAEMLWREGMVFSLLFVGGNAWNSENFALRLAELRREGRPVESRLGISDATLWALYRLSRCVVFPSVNEGFGLPVAESLASGTPVVTSGYGSMRELALDGGAILVDPRDDRSIAAGLRDVISNDSVHRRLVAEAHARPSRGWDAYAAELWDFLIDGRPRNG